VVFSMSRIGSTPLLGFAIRDEPTDCDVVKTSKSVAEKSP